MIWLLIAVAAAGLDQFTKWIVVSNIGLYEEVDFIDGFVCWTYQRNKGAAFGMLADNRWVFMLLSAVALAVMIYILAERRFRPKSRIFCLALAFLAGGGAGNMIDRLFRLDEAGEAYVVDFIKTQFVDFAIFNVADSFITIGAVLLGIWLIFIESRSQRANGDGGKEDHEQDITADSGE